jgi:hypothetical protein
MFLRLRRYVAVTFAALSLAVVGAPMAGAQVEQDGLVNVNIGDITIQDINVGVAAAVAANVCGVKVGPVAVLGQAVDRSGDIRTVCESDAGDVTISQN